MSTDATITAIIVAHGVEETGVGDGVDTGGVTGGDVGVGVVGVGGVGIGVAGAGVGVSTGDTVVNVPVTHALVSVINLDRTLQ